MSADDILKIPPIMNYSEDVPLIDSTEFEKVVRSRRSIRVFDKTAIPEEIVQKCLDLALLAPNSSNLQPWEVYRVKTQELKCKLVDYCLNQAAAQTAAELFVVVARSDTWKRNNDLMKEVLENSKIRVPQTTLIHHRKVVPVAYSQGFLGIYGPLKKIIIFFNGLFKSMIREPTSETGVTTWAIKSTALLCENLMLSFRAFGYDTCPMEGMDSKRIKKLLKLNRKAYVVMVIAAGKRAKNGIFGPRIRFNRDLFIKEV